MNTNNTRDRIEIVGIIVDHAHDIFRIKVEGATDTVKAKLSGKMRLNKVSLGLGDVVRVELSPYDMTNGRIVYRYDKHANRYDEFEFNDKNRDKDKDNRKRRKHR